MGVCRQKKSLEIGAPPYTHHPPEHAHGRRGGKWRRACEAMLLRGNFHYQWEYVTANLTIIYNLYRPLFHYEQLNAKYMLLIPNNIKCLILVIGMISNRKFLYNFLSGSLNPPELVLC
jgi:hypothetical protein